MAQIAAYTDVKVNRTQREIPGGYAWRTQFLAPPPGAAGEPHAFLAEGTPQRTIGTHFHIVDQFQVIVSGGGVLGKHDLAIHAGLRAVVGGGERCHSRRLPQNQAGRLGGHDAGDVGCLLYRSVNGSHASQAWAAH